MGTSAEKPLLFPMLGEVGVHSWAGTTWHQVRVIGETPMCYVVQAIKDMKVAGRGKWLMAGETKRMRKHVVRISSV